MRYAGFVRQGSPDACRDCKTAPRFHSSGLQEGWLSPVEGTRLEIERGVKLTVGSNPTPSADSQPPARFFPMN